MSRQHEGPHKSHLRATTKNHSSNKVCKSTHTSWCLIKTGPRKSQQWSPTHIRDIMGTMPFKCSRHVCHWHLIMNLQALEQCYDTFYFYMWLIVNSSPAVKLAWPRGLLGTVLKNILGCAARTAAKQLNKHRTQPVCKILDKVQSLIWCLELFENSNAAGWHGSGTYTGPKPRML